MASPILLSHEQSSTTSQLRQRVLIVEDDNTLNELLARQLGQRGYNVVQCFDGQDGLSQALSGSFNLILLDVLLPGLDGFELLSQLRQQQCTPVIMLTACGAEEDRISGFQCGADDYLAKPFNITELMLRIEAVLRRSQSLIVPEVKTRLVFQELVLEQTTHTASLAETVLDLTPMEFDLLWALLQSREEVLSKPYLYQELMGRPFSRYDRSLDMHVSKLRRKLQTAGFDAGHIQTVHGQGYRWK